MTESADVELARADYKVPRDLGVIRISIVPIHWFQSTFASIAVSGPLCGNISPSLWSDMHCIS